MSLRVGTRLTDAQRAGARRNPRALGALARDRLRDARVGIMEYDAGPGGAPQHPSAARLDELDAHAETLRRLAPKRLGSDGRSRLEPGERERLDAAVAGLSFEEGDVPFAVEADAVYVPRGDRRAAALVLRYLEPVLERRRALAAGDEVHGRRAYPGAPPRVRNAWWSLGGGDGEIARDARVHAGIHWRSDPRLVALVDALGEAYERGPEARWKEARAAVVRHLEALARARGRGGARVDGEEGDEGSGGGGAAPPRMRAEWRRLAPIEPRLGPILREAGLSLDAVAGWIAGLREAYASGDEARFREALEGLRAAVHLATLGRGPPAVRPPDGDEGDWDDAGAPDPGDGYAAGLDARWFVERAAEAAPAGRGADGALFVALRDAFAFGEAFPHSGRAVRAHAAEHLAAFARLRGPPGPGAVRAARHRRTGAAGVLLSGALVDAALAVDPAAPAPRAGDADEARALAALARAAGADEVPRAVGEAVEAWARRHGLCPPAYFGDVAVLCPALYRAAGALAPAGSAAAVPPPAPSPVERPPSPTYSDEGVDRERRPPGAFGRGGDGPDVDGLEVDDREDGEVEVRAPDPPAPAPSPYAGGGGARPATPTRPRPLAPARLPGHPLAGALERYERAAELHAALLAWPPQLGPSRAEAEAGAAVLDALAGRLADAAGALGFGDPGGLRGALVDAHARATGRYLAGDRRAGAGLVDEARALLRGRIYEARRPFSALLREVRRFFRGAASLSRGDLVAHARRYEAAASALAASVGGAAGDALLEDLRAAGRAAHEAWNATGDRLARANAGVWLRDDVDAILLHRLAWLDRARLGAMYAEAR